MGVLWPGAQQRLHFREGVGRSLRDAFDGLVFEIAYEAPKAELMGMMKDEAAEADALNSSGDDEVCRWHEVLSAIDLRYGGLIGRCDQDVLDGDVGWP